MTALVTICICIVCGKHSLSETGRKIKEGWQRQKDSKRKLEETTGEMRPQSDKKES